MTKISLRKFQFKLLQKCQTFILNYISNYVHKLSIITMPAVGTKGRLLIWIPLDLLEGLYSTSFHLFDLCDKVLRTHRVCLSQGVHISGLWKEVVIT